MKYMLLIHQGDTPTPRDRRQWASLSEDEQKAVYADYQAINETPGVTPGLQLQDPETATTVRVQDGKTLTTDGPFVETQGGDRRLPALRGRRPRRRDRAGRADPGGPPGRRDRGAPDRGVVAILEQAFRDQWGRVLAALIGFLGDFDLAEEAAQEAFAIAAERWPRDGVPANPGAWLVTTARNRAIDRIRRDRTLAAKTRLLEVPEAAEDTVDETTFPDERLELVFTCCHPALATDAQVALTLRTLGGLTTDEIARAFLVPEADDGPAAGAGEAQDQGRRDPVPRASRPPAARPARRRARGRLPDLQRGLRRPRRAGGRGAPARAGARRADARRAGGARPAGDDAAARRPPRGAVPRRRAGAARRPGPLALGHARRSPTGGRCSTGRWPCTAAVPTSCRRRSRRCTPTSRATGPRSPPSTASSPASPTRRSSS